MRGHVSGMRGSLPLIPVFLLLLSTRGVAAWPAYYDGGMADEALDTDVDSAGNLYVVGLTQKASPCSSAVDFDMLTLKYGPAGDSLWADTADFYNDDVTWGVDVNGSDVVTCATFVDTSDTSSDAFDMMIRRYDGAGNLLSSFVGDFGANEFATDVAHYRQGPESRGDILYLGRFGLNFFDPLLFIMRLNPTGDSVLWWAGLNNGLATFPRGLAVDGADNAYCIARVGAFSPTRALLVSYDPKGNLRFAVADTGGGSYTYAGIALDRAGRVLVTKTFFDGYVGPALLVYDTLGNLLWSRSYPYSLTGGLGDVAVDTAGNIVVLGGREVSGAQRMFTLKLTPTGDTLWTRLYMGEPLSGASSVAVDRRNFIYVTGVRNPTGYYYEPRNDIITVKYDEDGNFVSVREAHALAAPAVRLVPNPFVRSFVLRGVSDRARVSVFAADGRLVLRARGTGSLGEALPPGVYLVRFVNGARSAVLRAVKR